MRTDVYTDRLAAETTKVVFAFRGNANEPEKLGCYTFSFKKYSHFLTELHLKPLNGAERLLGRPPNSCSVNHNITATLSWPKACKSNPHLQRLSSQNSILILSSKVSCRFWWPLSSRVRMFHPDSAWKRSSNLHETYQCRMYSKKLLMMGKEVARNM